MAKIIAVSTLLILSLLIVTGCETPIAVPAATPTRTPVIPTATWTLTPTVTPTSTPTQTPTPTPTLPPNLVLQPMPVSASSWFPLPTDLFFLRNGRINIWLAEGTHIELPLIAEDNQNYNQIDEVHSFHVTPDGRFIAYVTTSGKLYRLDRATWEHTMLPTSGYLIEQNKAAFALTDDGNHIYYLAWGTQPSTASSPRSPTSSATLLDINAQEARELQKYVGYCEGAGNIPCLGFQLSPGGRQLSYLDGHGGWLSSIEGNSPLFLTPHSDGTFTDILWSPDGRWLLFSGEGAEPLLFDTNLSQPIPHGVKVCDGPCSIEHSWSGNTLWFIIRDAGQACLVEVDPESIVEDQPTFLNRICKIDNWELEPTNLHALPDNRIQFMHGGCGPQCAGPAAGFYIRIVDNSIYPLALTDEGDGTIFWTSDGSAFLYTSQSNATSLVGLINTPAYWDVTTLLSDSTSYLWGMVNTPNQ